MFLNNRYLDPTLGRFVSVDPLVSVTGDAYGYASNNPISYMDPTGLGTTDMGQIGEVSKGGCGQYQQCSSAAAAVLPGVDDFYELQNRWAHAVADTASRPLDPFIRQDGMIACVGLDGCKAALGYLNGSRGTRLDMAVAKYLALNAGIASGDLGSSSSMALGEKYLGTGLMFLGAIVSAGVSSALADAGGATPGSLNILGDGFSASEASVAMELAERGNAVVLRQATGNGRMSDLLVNGLAYDVYSPTTSNVSRIVSAVASKGSQVRGGGVVIDLSGSSLTAADLGNILARVQGVSGQISDIIVVGG